MAQSSPFKLTTVGLRNGFCTNITDKRGLRRTYCIMPDVEGNYFNEDYIVEDDIPVITSKDDIKSYVKGVPVYSHDTAINPIKFGDHLRAINGHVVNDMRSGLAGVLGKEVYDILRVQGYKGGAESKFVSVEIHIDNRNDYIDCELAPGYIKYSDLFLGDVLGTL